MVDDLLPNLRDQGLAQRNGLKEYFEDRTVAEMSIWFWIAAVSGLMLMVLAVAAALCLVAVAGQSSDTAELVIVLGGVVLWFGFLVWLWISLARIARGWGPERLGTSIFKHLQIAFLIITVLTMLGRGVLIEDFRILLLLLVAFDVVILGMIMVFLLLAWSARCRVPWRTYREILVIATMFVLQIIMMT